MTQQCFALLPQINFLANNLNFHWRWWDWIQAIFLNLFYFKMSRILVTINMSTYIATFLKNSVVICFISKCDSHSLNNHLKLFHIKQMTLEFIKNETRIQLTLSPRIVIEKIWRFSHIHIITNHCSVKIFTICLVLCGELEFLNEIFKKVFLF